MKRILSCVLAVSLLTTPSFYSAHAQELNNISIEIDGKILKTDQNPIINNNRTLVPLRGIFEASNAEVAWDEQARTITVKRELTTLVLKIGSLVAQKDDKTVTLDTAPQIVNGRTLVPIRFIAETLGVRVDWIEYDRKVIIVTNNSTSTNNNVANNQNQITTSYSNVSEALSLVRAIELAKNNSKVLKNASTNIDRSEIIRDDSVDKVKFTPAAGSSNPNPQANNSFTNLVQNDLSIKQAKDTFKLNEDQLVYSVQKAYYTILQDQESLGMIDLNLKNQHEQLIITNAKYNVGQASKTEVTTAQNNYNALIQKQQAAVKTLADDIQKLNQLIGSNADKKYQLTDLPNYEKLSNSVVLESHVNKVIDESPSIALQDIQVSLKRLNLDMYVFNAGDIPYKAKQMDVETAANNAADAKDALAKSVRSIYYSIKLTEDNYEAAKANLATAEESLKVLLVKFDAGMAIKADVTAAELKVEEAKKILFELTVQHELSKIAFDKPWAAGGAF